MMRSFGICCGCSIRQVANRCVFNHPWQPVSMPPTPDKTEPAAEDRSKRPLRIVLLDDVEEVRAAHRVMIQSRFADADIIECENGDEAWKSLQTSPPDLFITDLTHPGLRGEELSKLLADANPDLPILVVSAFQPEVDSLREQHGANPQLPRGFMDKPFKAKVLHVEINRLIASRAGGA